MESRSADIHGIRMHWLEQGEGHPVVLIHGIPTGPRLWRAVMPRLHDVRALAWEMVGYGASILEGRHRDISVAGQAEYLAAWLRTLGLQGALLVGHDLGGAVAQVVAVRYRELISGLVLVNAVAYGSQPIASFRVARRLGILVRRVPNDLFLQAFRSYILQGHDDPVCGRDSFAEHWQPYASTDGAAAFVRQVRSLHAHDTLAIADQLSRLAVPARIVWGTGDRFQPIGNGYRLAYDLGAKLDRVDGGKHFLPEDHANVVAASISATAGRLSPSD